ncbi:unnamed protein product [Medioppia subpectinata]|uniref:PDZ domain-containing protein n=1 Tax=Medioppia subpectinata TaxID=1979941 RepID=A0A7R9Q4T3_9ACAR|nr:unnamed protein product [Medioppia subpectinata]CAG2112648.1 unnamed protein product [Medioppia subpectinata]
MLSKSSSSGSDSDEQYIEPFSEKWFQPFVSIYPSFMASDPKLDLKADPNVDKGVPYLLGSGIIWDERGYVLTHPSVVNRFNRFLVRLGDGQEVMARFWYTNDAIEISVIKLDGNRNDWPMISTGDSKALDFGDRVLVVGNPRPGIRNHLTHGCVTHTRRKGSEIEGIHTKGIVMKSISYIQHMADVMAQDVGSALVDAEGDVIGLNVKQFALNVNVAIPIHMVETFFKKFTSVESGPTLGAELYWLTPELRQWLKQYRQVPDVNGVLIYNFLDNNNYHWTNTGVRKYDVITAINGSDVRSLDDLYRAVDELMISGVMNVVVNADGVVRRLVLQPTVGPQIAPSVCV